MPPSGCRRRHAGCSSSKRTAAVRIDTVPPRSPFSTSRSSEPVDSGLKSSSICPKTWTILPRCDSRQSSSPPRIRFSARISMETSRPGTTRPSGCSPTRRQKCSAALSPSSFQKIVTRRKPASFGGSSTTTQSSPSRPCAGARTEPSLTFQLVSRLFETGRAPSSAPRPSSGTSVSGSDPKPN